MDHEDTPSGAQPGNRPGDGAPQGGTEQVEDYLRLEEHIQQLQADRRPRRPRQLSPEQARVYQTAALFRAAAPGAAEPTPDFVARLRANLDQQVQSQNVTLTPRRPGVSRRGLLTGGLSAAAAAAGIAIGIGVDRVVQGPVPSATSLVPDDTGTWVSVVAVDALPVGAVFHFVTAAVVGFVRHTPAGYEALSGACTHMGCLLSWNTNARTFDCPCHGGRFLETGQPAPTSPVPYKPLPTIQTQVRDGRVQVYVPSSGSATPTDVTPGGVYQP